MIIIYQMSCIGKRVGLGYILLQMGQKGKNKPNRLDKGKMGETGLKVKQIIIHQDVSKARNFPHKNSSFSNLQMGA